MPNYIFQRIGAEEVKDFFFSMKEAPPIGSVIFRDKIKWRRVASRPQTVFSGLKAIDPFSAKDFTNKTGQMKGTVGDLWDMSKEQSQRRAERNQGVDPIKQKYFEDYKKKKRGTPHSQELKDGHKAAKEHLEKGLKKLGLEMPKVKL